MWTVVDGDVVFWCDLIWFIYYMQILLQYLYIYLLRVFSSLSTALLMLLYLYSDRKDILLEQLLPALVLGLMVMVSSFQAD